MRHAVAFVFRNWPLKLAAILLATLLYAGLIVSASAETFQGRIPIQLLNQPQETFVLGDIEDVTSVRYLAIGTDRPQITSASFTVSVDLAAAVAVPGAPSVSFPIDVRSVDPAIQVIDFTPSRVAIRLDPLVTREVPVTVDLGTVPPGLDVRTPVVSVNPVTVSGPDSAVRSVAAALARVRLDPSGIDVNETVGLLPVDARGEVVSGADVQPSAVRVTIQIGSQLSTRTLPVSPVVTGTPASSVEIASVEVQPALVTVEGEADALAGLVSIDTRPVAISGATADVETAVGLDLPDGVAALGVDQVRVTITIRPRTGTRTFEAGVEVVNGGPDFAYRPAIDRVLVTVGGTLEALDAVDPTRIAARLDVAGLGPGTAPVAVTARLPPGVALVSASPVEVTVTVTPVATPTSSPTPAPTAAP
ncbi:MAG TPA: CdaR family protein [Candidatus Limnocylindrales bacterium]|nr:CdaR family protein [Candidatus Limnocylindrales bacterium]